MEASDARPARTGSVSLREATELEDRVRAELEPEFELVRRLGGGSLSTVYLAREPALQRLVAIKVLHPLSALHPKSLARFRREARSLARVSHPNVVSIFRIGEIAGDLPYLVMRYVPGRDLARRLKTDGAVPLEDACKILSGIAAALAAVHSHAVVHRDVRPASVLQDERDGHVVLADFGLAAFRGGSVESGERITTVGHVITDLRYSSPEILRGEDVTGASDVYALGVTAFEILTGASPYDAASARDWAVAHVERPPASLSARGVVAPGLEPLVSQCLAKDPGDRPAAGDLAQKLGAMAPVKLTREAEVSAGVTPFSTPRAFELRTLGGLDLRLAGSSVTAVLRQPKRVALLAYLAARSESGYRRRDTLIATFWPDADCDSARHSLRQALYVLRRELGRNILLTRGDEEVGVDPAALVCDAARFETLAREGRSAEAMALYRGDLLPGFYLDDAPDFERWLDRERVRLRRMAAEAAWSIASQATVEGNGKEAARWARTAVDLDPFDESALHRLIEILDAQGDRAGALAAYEHFERRLAAEFEVEPSPETRRLIDTVKDRR